MPLLEAYAPDLLAAQREYAIAMQGVQALEQAGPDAQRSMQQLADASLARLRNWDVSDEQIQGLDAFGYGQPHTDVPLTGQRFRVREEGRARHALHAW